MVPVAVVGVLLAGVLAFVVARTVTEKVTTQTVELVAVEEAGDDPFTDSVSLVSAADLDGLQEGLQQVDDRPASGSGSSGSASEVVGLASVEDAVVFGATKASPCDGAKLVTELSADPALLEAWADLSGVEPAQVGEYVAGLTPLVLGWDTAVTNTRYRNGKGQRFQAVLQAGTAVLVDAHGVPRVKCSCGNPLAPAELVAESELEFQGTRWDGFEANGVVEVQGSEEPLKSVRAFEVESGRVADVAVGGSVTLDGMLMDDDTGVYVVDDNGTRTQVLDVAVDEVFDDGEGGLIYQHARPGRDGTTEPTADAEEAVIWHLPAGVDQPRPLIEPSEPGGWVSLEDVGVFGGELSVAYFDLRKEGDEGFRGPLRARSMVSAKVVTLIEDAWHISGSDSEGTDSFTVGHFAFADRHVAWLSGSFDHSFVLCQQVPASWDELTDPVVSESAEVTCDQELWTVFDVSSDGRLVWFEDFSGTESKVEMIDVATGGDLGSIPVAGDFENASRRRIDAEQDGTRVVISFEFASPPAVIVDLATGDVQRIELGGRASFLKAPLRRPAGTVPAASGGNPAQPPDEPAAPTWDEIKGASIPSLCEHPPTTLVDGVHTEIEAEYAYFYLTPELDGQDVETPGIVQGLDSSDAGQLTAVVATCNQGGVGWPSLLVLFSAGGEYYASSFLYDAPAEEALWDAAGLESPARDGIRSMEIIDGRLVIGMFALLPGECEACASGYATVVVGAQNRSVVVDSVEQR